MKHRTFDDVPMGVAVACLLGMAGCATPGAPLPADIKDPARRTYYDGMRELVDGDYLKATTLFQTVAASPRHIKHASLAKLRLGDALFFQGRYAEATEIFRSFVQQNNVDPNLPYARFKVAECYYERLPGEWFASPPAHEFDQTIATQAEAELKGFVTTFPTSVYVPRARTMLATARKLLFRHEMYVVDFYDHRGKWHAVAWRLRDAIDAYPELGVRDDLVWRLARAWDKVGDRDETQRALGLYLAEFPTGKRLDAAKARLDVLTEELEAEKQKLEAEKQKLEAERQEKEKAAPAPTPEETPEETPDEPGELQLRPLELPPLTPE